MSESDILQTFAEVGVAMAGFTGVVFVLGNRATGEWSRVEKLWFHILLSSSAHVVAFALLPLVLESYLSTSTAWRWSAGLLGVEGLSVVDASVIPAIPRANTHLTAVMIAERAASFLVA